MVHAPFPFLMSLNILSIARNIELEPELPASFDLSKLMALTELTYLLKPIIAQYQASHITLPPECLPT